MTRRQGWEEGEPAVEELLSDPIFEFLMRRDGLSRADVWRAIEDARRNLSRGRQPDSAAA